MVEEMSSLGVRLQGTPEQIEEGLRRIKSVLEFPYPPEDHKWYPTDHEKVKPCYIRCYFLNQKNLWNQLEAAKQQIQELEECLGRLDLDNQRLKEKLGEMPKPRPGDMVLGAKSSIARSQIT